MDPGMDPGIDPGMGPPEPGADSHSEARMIALGAGVAESTAAISCDGVEGSSALTTAAERSSARI